MLLALLARLGCDPAKDAELALVRSGPGALRSLEIEWRFHGRVLAGGDAPARAEVRRDESDPVGVLRLVLELELSVDGLRA